MSDKRFIKLPEVQKKTSLSRAAIYKRIARNAFPAQAKLGTTSVWLESEIDEWMQAVLDGRVKLEPGEKKERGPARTGALERGQPLGA
ncbi:AlpA family phage regulatory protein [Dyella marensis]|uniref:Transcriptional regulator, AlpA family n=1 Tax=Dyella marensis TaxID=500610 RepID=A0A1I2A768_9GAMM|nr:MULTISPECIES: AlpA family phage regulatory protein [Dyella]SFE38650.1 transcriptional regulator, AlpA family [Dyella marensis]